ncbi:MAG: Holliday junction resolvase RuvX [Anaerolineae bacterium]|nr:Holliday junction resolvase RuvX [Anaerolineae bacterium]
MTHRFLGIDYGLKRIGLAVSDPSGLVARELLVIQRGSNAEVFKRIQQVVAEQHITALVIGLPPADYAAPGEYTPGDRVRAWTQKLVAVIPLPVVFWDEQLSSVDARELSICKKRGPRDPIDDLAARIILQSYLDALRDGLAVPPDAIPNTRSLD